MKYLIIILLSILCMNNSNAQNIVQKGNSFTQVQKSSSAKETKTQYTYTDSKGNTYPVYLSGTGKAYIKRISKKSGKEYKSYMPEIGKRINPKAYQKQ